MKKAVVFGASGFLGSHLLEQMLKRPEYEQVTVVVRRRFPLYHPKLKMLIGDYVTLPDIKNQIEGEDVFITLGGTTPRINLDYPVLAAKIAKEKGAKSVFVVTAVGASIYSGISYLRTKSEIERNLIALDFEHLHIFRPSLLMGKRKEFHFTEKVILIIWKLINSFFIGEMSRYKGIEVSNMARAILIAAKNEYDKVNVYHWKDMNELLSQPL